MAGSMRYMQRQMERRLSPSTILPGAHTAVVLVKDYFNADPPERERAGRVAKYARGPDYHKSLIPPLEQLRKLVRSLGNESTVARWYVDSGPVPERELAQRAGLGWIGKNTMLIDPTRGSYTFLASILTDLELAFDAPFEADRCGSCCRCLDACPTSAFIAERLLDARRCISYITIEHRGEIGGELGRRMGNWVFGCDVCQDVCPWNQKFARRTSGGLIGLKSSRAYLDLDWLVRIANSEFQEALAWTPMERAGASGMRRNARVALGNLARETPCQTC
jgi:epoxyqueuosine reductase